MAERGFCGYPMATVAFYGPDDRRASKVAAGIVAAEEAEVDPLERWFCEEGDARFDPGIEKAVLAFVEAHRAKTVVFAEAILGCPHEEGVDYPQGQACPRCPFWAGRDRWAGVAASPAGKKRGRRDPKPKCGLCGKSGRLVRTECCGNWICDDEASYRPFSYERNSCARNHRRHTLCAFHHTEGHEGHWKQCAACRGSFDTETYVDLGTSEYNFEVLEDPPAFEPTLCMECGARIVLAEGGYTESAAGRLCAPCTARKYPMLRGLRPL
jgi:hypothetical protein